jgi:hypothetical protein
MSDSKQADYNVAQFGEPFDRIGKRAKKSTMRYLGHLLGGLCLIIVFAAFVDSVQAVPPNAAQGISSPSHAQQSPAEIYVGVQLLDIGQLNPATGTYAMSFYLSFWCDEACDPTDFEIRNAVTSTITNIVDDPDWQLYRISATLAADLSYQRYPFDSHALLIVVENRLLPVGEQVYVVDTARTGIDADAVIAGWEIEEGWAATVTDRFEVLTDEAYTEYTFEVTVSRPPRTAFLKGVLPGIFVVIVSLMGFALLGTLMAARLAIQSAALTAAYLFHLNFTASLPPTTYLTHADMFMIANYSALVLSIFVTASLLVMNDKGMAARIPIVNRNAWIGTIAVWITLQIVVWFIMHR